MPRFGKVLGIEQRQEFGIAQEIIPGEVNQPLDRFRPELVQELAE